MRVIDCFSYFDEDIILEIRLSTLYDYVDEFVVCEATLDHAGNEKNLILIWISLRNTRIKLIIL